jgi:hypothetical protein
MREVFEFRVFEKHARRFFDASVGQPLSSGIARKVEVESKSPLMKLIGAAHQELVAEGLSLFGGWSVHRSYSRQEINSSSAFLLKINTVFEPTGEEFGTLYDNSTACSLCGTGASQVGPLYLPESRMPKGKDFCKTIGGEIVASERARRAFEKNQLVGVEFLPIFSEPHLKRPHKSWFQLRCMNPSARLEPPTRFGIDPFNSDEAGRYRCSRGHLLGLNVLSEVTVALESPERVDLTCTTNYVGIREGLLRPERMLIVSQRLLHVMAAEHLKGVAFEIAHLSV